MNGTKQPGKRTLDIIFLIGVLFKGIDGVLELIAGVVLLVLSPSQLAGVAGQITAEELREDPHDLIANLLVHGAAHLDGRSTAFVAGYLLIHGIVKVAIVIALLLGSRKVYPWAIAALLGFLAFQMYQLVVQPTLTVVLLTVFDALIVWLTWREWRPHRTLHDTIRGLRHPAGHSGSSGIEPPQ